ncbi:hypothetical protein WMY93_011827 [Mugilogobius chulae]|uniref:Uncharacterized protein n=1 Tax=Mugilogobius chulae TaxID=88201 RepID=A0AAW0PEV3_9GOBI
MAATELWIYKTAPIDGFFGRVRWSSRLRPAPLLTSDPCRALIDEKISLKLVSCRLSLPVTLCTHMYCEDGDLWQSHAHYNADAQGFRQLQSFGGHVSPDLSGSELASVSIERWYTAPGVRRIEIRQDGLVGTLFLPPGPGPFPAMLDLWGMGGGLVEYRSALMASRGYASFALAYFGHKDLPGPLTRSMLDRHISSHQQFWTYNAEGQVFFREVSLPEKLADLVKLEDISCPILYVLGEDDLNASSEENAVVLEKTLKSCGKGHLFTLLSYPGAGHLIEPPFSPNARISMWTVKPNKLFTIWGGHLAPHAAAQEDAWTKIQQFLDTHLRGDRDH